MPPRIQRLRYECQACKREVTEREVQRAWIDPKTKELLCPECYFGRYAHCVHCGKAIPDAEIIEIEHHDPVCKECAPMVRARVLARSNTNTCKK